MRKPEISLFDVIGKLCHPKAKGYLCSAVVVERSALEEVKVHEEQLLIDKCISQLTFDEQYVIRRRFGFEGARPVTQEALGREIHKKRQSVQQIEKRALGKLKGLLQNMLGD